MAEHADFVGRERELKILGQELDQALSSGRGRFVLLRGRRQVGKSRFVEEFLFRTSAPNVFFAATKGRSPAAELVAFSRAVAESSLPVASVVRAGTRFDSWDGALALIAGAAGGGGPAVIVVDELPYLIEQDSSVEGAFQTAWDRHLSRAPVLLIVIGSDLSMMNVLTEYGRPLYQRPTREIHLQPLNIAELVDMLQLDAATGLDAYLVVGGFPLLARAWGRARDVGTFLRRELTDPTSSLIVAGERMVAAEFPPDAQPRAVLSAIGAGGRTFTGISQEAGVPRASLERALDLLVQKGAIAKLSPLSAQPSRLTRYIVADSYLRFWLRFIEPGIGEIERGRGELVARRTMDLWPDYRGVAVEPVVRTSIEQMLPSKRFGEAEYVGSYWTRTGDVEVDVVGARKATVPRRLAVVGSIKWRERSPFGNRDLASLIEQAARIPGTDEQTVLLAVSRSGFNLKGDCVPLGPEDLIQAWRESRLG